MLMTSCSDDAPRLGNVDTWGKDNIEVGYTVDQDITLARSGVAANARESRLDEAYALFFAREPESSMLTFKKVNVRPGQRKISFDPPAELDPDTDYDVLLVGNPKKYKPLSMEESDQLFQGFVNLSRGAVELRLALMNDGPITDRNPESLPMYGRCVDPADRDREIPFRYSVTTGDDGLVAFVSNAEFRFSRTVCRIDITNLVPEHLDMRWAKVCNYRNAGLVYTDGFLPADSKIIPLSEESPAPTPDDMGAYVAVSDAATGGQELRSALYAFPNIVQSAVQNDRLTTGLIIAGYYTDPTTGVKDTDLTYYRFNLANIGEAQLLKRNYAYTAVIKGVKRRGAASDIEAYNDQSPIFDYNVDDEWDVSDDNYATDGKGNFLIISKSHITFAGSHSSADKIELKVSTNPELTWTIEPVPGIAGNSNGMFVCEKFTANSLKAGPTSQNDTDYVRFGYYVVKAQAKSATAAPVNLSLRIYLQQLTKDGSFKCLTVDQSTGTIDVALPPTGGSVTLPVVTGADENQWKATSSDFSTGKFGATATYTKGGGNHTELIIKVEPNTTGTTLACNITVALDPDDPNVLPVTLRCTQKTSPHLLSISPKNDNMAYTINAFSLATGNPNGVVNPQMFVVKIIDPANYYYKVTSDFDKYRDMVLTKDAASTAAASHPAAGTVVNDDALLDMASGSRFYVNPFRTGPGDGDIVGTVRVSAYKKTDATRTPVETVTLNIRITTTPCRLDDVVIKDGSTWFLFPDRAAGMLNRVGQDGRNVSKFFANSNAAVMQINSERGVEILNNNSEYDVPTQQIVFKNASSYASNKAYNVDRTNIGNIDDIQYWINTLGDESAQYSPFYKQTYLSRWSHPNASQLTLMFNKIVFSKWRPFVVSDITADRPVCCWIQFHTKWTKNTTVGAVKNATSLYTAKYSSTASGDGATWGCHGLAYFYGASLQSVSQWAAAIRPVFCDMTAEEVELYRSYLNRGAHLPTD